MVRRLSAEERALWHKVARSVRPLDGVALPLAEAGAGPEPTRPPRRPASPASAPAPQRMGETLDAGWDRRLARGLVRPDRVVDLHGHGLAAAHQRLESGLAEAASQGARLVLLITGRPREGARPHGRGIIRASIGDWLAASPQAGRIAAIRAAHPRHGGAGALYVVLRRPPPKSRKGHT